MPVNPVSTLFNPSRVPFRDTARFPGRRGPLNTKAMFVLLISITAVADNIMTGDLWHRVKPAAPARSPDVCGGNATDLRLAEPISGRRMQHVGQPFAQEGSGGSH